MNLPCPELAVIREEKLTGYLLSEEHPVGRHKAAFFARFGFSKTDWVVLRDALLSHAGSYEVRTVEKTPYGRRYVIEGPLRSPDGRSPPVRSVWIVRDDQGYPEFVTAYPL